ncbi:MAG: thioesterase family protein [Microthrixaceae bacterium]
MDALEAAVFFGLHPAGGSEFEGRPLRWRLEVVPGLATRGRFLFGGCGLGASITALEAVTGRPTVWATAQYLSYATLGEVVDLDIVIATDGHFTTQGRVVGRVGDREVFTVNAALGSRPFDGTGRWERPPEVPEPEDCPARASNWDVSGTVMERMDMRLAAGRQWEDLDGAPSPDGRSALWIRLPELASSSATVAILGDYVPFGIAQALGRWTNANSLDNTIRVVNIVDTDWVLVDVRIHGVEHGFGHGLVHLWSQTGELMAVASQSSIVRDGEPTPRTRA